VQNLKWEEQPEWGWGVKAYVLSYTNWPFGNVRWGILAAKGDKAFDHVFNVDSSDGVMLAFDREPDRVYPGNRPFGFVNTIDPEEFACVWVDRMNAAKRQEQINTWLTGVEEAAERLSREPGRVIESLEDLICEAERAKSWMKANL
jgi:hypothetical protein